MEKQLAKILILFLIIYGCQEEKNNVTLNKQNVIVAGKIENLKSKVVSIVFQDIIRGQGRFSQIVDSTTGTFHFIFDIYHPQDIMFKYNNKYLQLYVEPNDSLFISFDFNKIQKNNTQLQEVLFSGNNKQLNEELYNYNLFDKTDNFIPNCLDKNVTGYLEELKKQIEKEQNDLKRFISSENPSTKFINWAKNNIVYNNANYLIDYTFINRSDSLFNTEIFPVNNANSLVSSMFGLHLWHYVNNKYIQNDSVTKNLLNEGKFAAGYSNSVENVLKNESEGLCRDIMIYKLLSSFFGDSFEQFEKHWSVNKGFINNHLLTEELNNRLLNEKELNIYGINFIDNFSTNEKVLLGDIFTELIEMSKNNLVYIDIWATWCGPCLSEIPHIIKIHKKMEDENIKFVSICCQSNRDKWNSIISNNNIPGQHYILDNEQSSLFFSNMNFKGFPTYLILKDGRIVNENAPRPSSGDRIINELVRINAL